MSKPIQDKPSRNEGEYFAKQDAELIARLRSSLDQERSKAERSSHFMKCPKCGGQLTERRAGAIVADVCGDCHGAWLDVGELEILGLHLDRAGIAERGMLDDLRDLFRIGNRK